MSSSRALRKPVPQPPEPEPTDRIIETLASTAGFIKTDGSRPFTNDQSMGGNDLTNVGAVEAATVQSSTLTASRLCASDGSKILVSVSNLASWIAGTTNEIDIADDGDGSITLSIASRQSILSIICVNDAVVCHNNEVVTL